jgi:hypothetical protein
LRLAAWHQVRDFANRLTSANGARTATTATLDQFATPAQATGASAVWEAGGWTLEASASRAEGQTRELFSNLGAGFTRARVAGGRQNVLGVAIAREGWTAGPLTLSWRLRADHWRHGDGVRSESLRSSGALLLDAPPPDRSGTSLQGALTMAHEQSGLSASLYRSARLPTLNELHRPFRVGNDATDANGLLNPEQLTGLDLGWSGEGQMPGLDWQVRAGLWWNRLDGPITNVTRGTGPGSFGRIGFLPAGGAYRVRENAGVIAAAGLQLTGRLARPGRGEQPGLDVVLGLNDAEVSDGGANTQLAGLEPAQTARIAGSLSTRLPLGAQRDGQARMLASLTLRQEGERFEDDLNSRRLRPYTALDARFDWRRADRPAGRRQRAGVCRRPAAGSGRLSGAAVRAVQPGAILTPASFL